MSDRLFYHRPFREQLGLAHRLEAALHAVGIMNMDQLAEVEAVNAYHRIAADREARQSVRVLYALQGALRGEHWMNFTPEQKAALRYQAGLE